MLGADPRTVAPYGSWHSPISAELVASGALRLDAPQADGDDRYWLEGRPGEEGRVVLVRRSADGAVADVTPPPLSVRTRVHEYGGGAYLAHGGTVWFSNFSDQRLWRLLPGAGPAPLPLTAAAEERDPPLRSVRYADARLTPGGEWLVCVRETHHGSAATDVVNELVAVRADSLDGRAPEVVLASGRDFYSFPRISPDGARLAWTCWDHPRMPWDGTELWVAELVSGGASGAGAGGGAGAPGLRDPRLVAGGPEESVFQPEWAPDRLLYYVTDAGRPGARRWRLARQDLDRGSREEGVDGTSPFASVGRPQWVFGLSTYALLPDGRPVVCWSEEGMDHLGVVSGAGGAGGAGGELDVPYTAVSHVVATGRGVLFLGAGPRTAREVVELAVGPGSGGAGGGAWPRTVGEPVVLARSRPVQLEPADLSEPEPVEFPTSDGRTAHALYYPPTSSRLRGPEHERPPLIVMSHGGPTSATSSALDLTVQYWTSRGIAVVDVDYGGSTGYGRAYRERLQGMWGIVDVDDCVNAALHLVERGDVDRERLAIRGGSAGGYTTLCALTFRDLFTAGASYYGVADAAALAADTHKFESHYTDGLIGPWPEAADLYRERSPLFHTDLLSCPLIVFQGLDDPVVPPNQAEALVAALAERGIPHAYLAFDGEQHGFRRAETVRRCLEAELSFYAAVLHFDLADPIEPVVIEGLPPA